MSCVRLSVHACVTLFKRTLKMSSRELKQASEQAGKQASTRKAFSQSPTLEGLVNQKVICAQSCGHIEDPQKSQKLTKAQFLRPQ